MFVCSASMRCFLWVPRTFIWAASWENQCFAYAKSKTQISFAVTSQLISAFVFATWIVQSLPFLNSKFQAYSYLQWLYSLVCVRPGQNPQCWFSHIAPYLMEKWPFSRAHREGVEHPQKKPTPIFHFKFQLQSTNNQYIWTLLWEISAKVNLKYWTESFLPNSKGLGTTHMNVDPKCVKLAGRTRPCIFMLQG